MHCTTWDIFVKPRRRAHLFVARMLCVSIFPAYTVFQGVGLRTANFTCLAPSGHLKPVGRVHSVFLTTISKVLHTLTDPSWCLSRRCGSFSPT